LPVRKGDLLAAMRGLADRGLVTVSAQLDLRSPAPA